MSKSVPTRDEVITGAVRTGEGDRRSVLVREERALDRVIVGLSLDLLRKLVREVLSEAVVLARARATYRLADLRDGLRETSLHLDRDLVGADVRAAEVV